MLSKKTLNDFVSRVNHAHQQFCVWVYANNEFAKYQKEWNEANGPRKVLILPNEFSRDKGCKYKNFWSVTIPSLQHGWILSLSRLFDPAYNFNDKKKQKPRLSFYYILDLLINDNIFTNSLLDKIKEHEKTIKSLKVQRNNFLAHNDVYFTDRKIEAGIENLFEELDNIISEIKQKKKELANCNNINLEYTEALSRCGVEEIFESLIERKPRVAVKT